MIQLANPLLSLLLCRTTKQHVGTGKRGAGGLTGDLQLTDVHFVPLPLTAFGQLWKCGTIGRSGCEGLFSEHDANVVALRCVPEQAGRVS